MRESAKSIGWLLLTYLVFCGIAFGQDPDPSLPDAVITDRNGNPLPEVVQADEVIYLSALQSSCGDKRDSVDWIIKPKSRADRSTTFENNRILSLPLGKYTTDITVLLVVAKGDITDWTEITIHVNGDPPGPVPPGPTPPGPTPPGPQPPAPIPPLPPDLTSKYGLAKVAYNACLEVTPTRTRSAECTAMADCLLAAKTIAVAVASTTPEQIVRHFETAVKETRYLSADEKVNWRSFAAAIVAGLDEVANLPENDPRFLAQTRDAYVEAFEELEAGVRAASIRTH